MGVRASLPTLGPYEVVKHLASGGMADVLIARTTEGGLERHVVLKRIRAEQADDERYVAMFLDEARLASSLHHPNVVQVHDIGEARGEFYFTMEYVHGEDARGLLTEIHKRDEMIPLAHVISIAIAAAGGLHHAHEAYGPDHKPLDIVHRDVSPANILVGYDGAVKVADFGIAKATKRNVQTQAGTLKGKVAYMSPEQCVGDAIDRRSDVFSLGIVLYELLTVRRLFKGDTEFLTMTSIVLGHIPPPSKFRPEIPEALEDILMKALENKPGDRYQTADEMRRALEAFATAHGYDTSPDALATYMKATFGARPMPWEDDEPELELSVDFDGSASGIVAPVSPPARAQTSTELLENPSVAPVLTGPALSEQRLRAPTADGFESWETPEPPVVPRAARAPSVIVESELEDTPPVEASAIEPRAVAVIALPTPRAASISVGATGLSRWWWVAGGAVAAGVTAVVVAIVLAVGVSSTETPVALPVVRPPVEPRVVPSEPVTPPNLVATLPPPMVEKPPPAAKPPVRPRMGPAKKKIAPKKKAPAKWNPSALFPDRK